MSEPSAAGDSPSKPEPDPGTGRRAPRFTRFIVTGALVGALVALATTLRLPDPEGYSATTVAGYLMAIGALLGAVAGAGLAVLADRRS